MCPILVPGIRPDQKIRPDQEMADRGGQTQKVDFDTWTLNADFDTSGLGTYTFVTGREWTKSDAVTAYTPGKSTTTETIVSADEEYWALGSGTLDTEVGSSNIEDMKVYQYRGDNPLLSAAEEKTYYDTEIVQNFRFYRFTGNALYGGIPLDNFIIAVDTVKGFVYTYSAITEPRKISGIATVPNAFAAVEKNEDKNENGTLFYQFDPIGYVNDDGTVTLYGEYKTAIGKPAEEGGGTSYFPSVGEGDTVATKSENGFGRSPYYTK